MSFFLLCDLKRDEKLTLFALRRFANGVPATHLGARFYAGLSPSPSVTLCSGLTSYLSTGVPLLAPNFGNPDAPAIPIGTLCVADDRPRDGFTPEQRMVL